jgi:hypothetical protein
LVVAASRPLKATLAAALALTLCIKLASADYEVPSSENIVAAVAVFLANQGFAVDTSARIAGRAAVIAERDNCVLEIVPIAAQGWNQSSLRETVQRREILTYIYKGGLRDDGQERWIPLFNNYARLSLRRFAVPVGYEPILAVVHPRACDPRAIDWAELPPVPFVRRGAAPGQSAQGHSQPHAADGL